MLCDTTVWTLLHIATVQNCEVCVHKVFHAFCSSRANPVCRLESGNPFHIWFILAILDIQQGLRHRIRSHHSKCQNENLHSLLAPHCNSNNFSSIGPKEICICKLAVRTADFDRNIIINSCRHLFKKHVVSPKYRYHFKPSHN